MTAITQYAQEVSDLVLGTRDQFERMAGSSLQFEKEAGFAIQLLTGNDYALSIARSNKQSVINAVTNVAAIGISLNPARKQAYLVPRDGKICLDISYMGLLDIAIQSGSILWGQAEIVHASDKFELHGFDKPPMHARNPFDTDRGPIVGAYVVVKTRDGDYLTTAMPIKDVYDIRDRSSAWKAWVTKQKKCPWVTDEGEMIKKTVIKRAYKLWPKTDRLDTAVHHLNTDGEEGIEFAQDTVAQPIDRADWEQRISEALDKDALTTLWGLFCAACAKAKDKEGYKALKPKFTAKGATFQAVNVEDAKVVQEVKND